MCVPFVECISCGEERRGAQRTGNTIAKKKQMDRSGTLFFLAGVNALPALCVDVGERREKPLNCVYVFVHAVGENQVDAH